MSCKFLMKWKKQLTIQLLINLLKTEIKILLKSSMWEQNYVVYVLTFLFKSEQISITY